VFTESSLTVVGRHAHEFVERERRLLLRLLLFDVVVLLIVVLLVFVVVTVVVIRTTTAVVVVVLTRHGTTVVVVIVIVGTTTALLNVVVVVTTTTTRTATSATHTHHTTVSHHHLLHHHHLLLHRHHHGVGNSTIVGRRSSSSTSRGRGSTLLLSSGGGSLLLLSQETLVRRLEHVATHHGRGSNHILEALMELDLEHGHAVVTALSDVDDEGLAVEHTTVHFTESKVGFFSRVEGDETETTRVTLFVSHDLAGLDVTESLEEFTEVLVSEVGVEVADVEVVTARLTLEVLLTEFDETFSAVLGTSDVQRFTFSGETFDVLFVEVFNGLDGIFVLLEVAEGEGASLGVVLGDGRSDTTELGEELFDVRDGGLREEVLDVDVGEVLNEEGDTGVTTDEVGDVERVGPTFKSLAVHFRESLVSVLFVLEVNETITTALTFTVSHDLGGEDGAIVGEDVDELGVVGGGFEVADEEVTATRDTESGVTLLPHETDTASTDGGEVEVFDGLFGIGVVLEVDVTITEGFAGDDITANTNRDDGTAVLEGIKELIFTDGRIEVTNEDGDDGSLFTRSSSSGGSSSGGGGFFQ